MLDSFDPQQKHIAIEKRSALDKWILSRLQHLIEDVHQFLTVFDIHKAARSIERFLIEDFSNWYLRRSRKRLWVEESTTDKEAAYLTMYEIFVTLAKLIAPFTPFIADEIYLNLRTPSMPESVHLCDYPISDPKNRDITLEEGMKKIRDLVEVGRALRSKIGIKAVSYTHLRAHET